MSDDDDPVISNLRWRNMVLSPSLNMLWPTIFLSKGYYCVILDYSFKWWPLKSERAEPLYSLLNAFSKTTLFFFFLHNSAFFCTYGSEQLYIIKNVWEAQYIEIRTITSLNVWRIQGAVPIELTLRPWTRDLACCRRESITGTRTLFATIWLWWILRKE